ncbi:methyltransferase domain-containing protein [Paenibacillus sp. ACRSA]|uniref:methyltransferase domain-containing protein n=1 Tax=Paenibacillus sp. ACRSA TaxID=2918211 RepID=UPI001EF69B3D|nr:methyltransferase domain-containing protein [Paenibacillus sp. ACRSA]MCG7377677.1 methyltransferase domain-containing protein [Paenibacillus sp. ACRSA]
MHLIIQASGEDASVVSHLLAKNPNNIYDRTDKGVRVRMVYTRATSSETEVLIHAEPDPVDLVRGSPDGYDITQYINDREFVTSSLFCSYIRSALGTALNGKPKEEYTKWVEHPFDLQLSFGPVASDLPDRVVEELFSHLGYAVTLEREELSYSFDLKKRSSVRRIILQGKETVQNALRQLFLLIPVLDNYKHYFISEDEIDKIKRYGDGWLETHPHKELIVKRTLRFAELIKKYESKEGALSIPDNKPLSVEELEDGRDVLTEGSIEASTETSKDAPTDDTPVRLNELRYRAITEVVARLPHRQRIVDMGAGEGKLSARLATIAGVESILAVEPSGQSRLRAMERFAKLEGRHGVFAVPEPIIGSLFYFDEQLQHQDVMILCEVIEHIEAYRLDGIMNTLLQEYQPEVLIVTTPNKEYNDVYAMEQESFRHHDHRFEWTRAELAERCVEWSAGTNYTYTIQGIGEQVEGYGQPTQMIVFGRREEGHQQ